MSKPLHDREAIPSLRSGGKAEQLAWLQMLQQSGVGLCGSMVKFVDDQHIKMVRCNGFQTSRGQRLNRREDMFEGLWAMRAYPQFPKGRVTQCMAISRQALLENLAGPRTANVLAAIACAASGSQS